MQYFFQLKSFKKFTFSLRLCVCFYSLVYVSIHLCMFPFTCVCFYSLVYVSIHLCMFLFTCVCFYSLDQLFCGLFGSVIEQLGGKQMVMQYLSHEDPNVRFEALIALQKLMVHNW